MPIYAYKCTSCAHVLDVLQKVSDPPLTVCPNCGAPALVKQVTAAGFQLKGSGWYVTDFRDGGSNAAKKAEKSEPAGAGGGDGATPAPAPAEAPKAAEGTAPAAKPAASDSAS